MTEPGVVVGHATPPFSYEIASTPCVDAGYYYNFLQATGKPMSLASDPMRRFTNRRKS